MSLLPEHVKRTAGLDGVRGVAALTVFIFHIWLYGREFSGGGKPETWDYIALQFRVGLICFFVLSGYLLYRAFVKAARRQRGPLPWGPYLKRRAARILPAYYVALFGAIVLLEPARGEPGVRVPAAGDLPLFAFFAQNYSSETIMKLNPVTWTLCLEVAFYLLLPVVGAFAYYVGKGRVWPQVAMLSGWVAVGMVWHAITFWEGWSQIASKALLAYLPYFALGMFTALYVEERRARKGGDVPPVSSARTWAIMLAGAAAVLASAWWHAESPGPRTDFQIALWGDIPAAIGFALIILAVAIGRGPSLGWLTNKPIVALGVVSYGFYLWHVPLILFARAFLDVPANFFWMFVVLFPLTLAFAAASWFLIEKPLLNAVNSRLATNPVR